MDLEKSIWQRCTLDNRIKESDALHFLLRVCLKSSRLFEAYSRPLFEDGINCRQINLGDRSISSLSLSLSVDRRNLRCLSGSDCSGFIDTLSNVVVKSMVLLWKLVVGLKSRSRKQRAAQRREKVNNDRYA